jgi:hypothetical protein
MPFGSYETPKPPAPPTFLQFLKTIGKGVEGKTKFDVDIVWLPGKFQNVTLQTHAFRYICDESHPLFNEVQEYLKIVVPGNNYPRLEIVIDSIEKRTISVIESTRKTGTWEKLGSSAMKFKVPS